MRLEENFKYYYHIYRVDKNYHQMLKFLKFQKINVKIKRTGQLGSTFTSTGKITVVQIIIIII